MVPKFTTLQTKLIRTTEGWLVVVFNQAMIVVPIATSALSATTAATLAAGTTTVTVLARQLAKGIAGWQAPLLSDGTPKPAAVPTFKPEQIAALKEALSTPKVTPAPPSANA